MKCDVTALFVEGVGLWGTPPPLAEEPVVMWLNAFADSHKVIYHPPQPSHPRSFQETISLAATRWEYDAGVFELPDKISMKVRRYWPDWCLQVENSVGNKNAMIALLDELHTTLGHRYFAPPLHVHTSTDAGETPAGSQYREAALGSGKLIRSGELYRAPAQRCELFIQGIGNDVLNKVLSSLLVLEYDLRVMLYRDLGMLYGLLPNLRTISDQIWSIHCSFFKEDCGRHDLLDEIAQVQKSTQQLEERVSVLARDIFTCFLDIRNYSIDVMGALDGGPIEALKYHTELGQRAYDHANVIAGEAKGLVERVEYLKEILENHRLRGII